MSRRPVQDAPAPPAGSADPAVEAVERAFATIRRDGRAGIWITLVDEADALAAAAAVDARVRAGDDLALAGLTLAVKDNIDVAGMPTTAGCPAYAYRPARTAPVVEHLVAAGAVVVGKTNLDQFATGLVGTRSGYGICPNAAWPDLVAGGSSSGSAVAVATGMADLALGTDTAGSGRVPAACNGVIGLKPTRGRISTAGIVPACRSLDTVSTFARRVDLAARVAAIAARSAPDPADPWSRASPPSAAVARPVRRVAVPARRSLDFDGDAAGARRFAAAVAAIADAPGPDRVELVEVDLAPFVDAGALLYEGAFVAERFEAVGAFVHEHRDAVHPVVGAIIDAAAALPAWRAFADRTRLERHRVAADRTWSVADVLVVPSVPRIPTVAEVLEQPVARNTMLGRYTNFVNLLDLAAVTIPLPAVAHDPARPPVSVTLVGPAWSDATLTAFAARLVDGPAS